ncbi:unnamed protein product [Brachionus calyciflorus]|uniref:Tc1-like transposase DDE domain-containing protein n=1 Tax=Brachionus calyciflorus TaxID=104777 RepID=A0A814E642_9BILA|nr:unnamed protein product [Brachionus calyciflorus]
MIEKNREYTSRKIKESLRLRCSQRSIRRYIQTLGWKYRKTKFCQAVSVKNRIERLFYCFMCLFTNENFDDIIFIDETTVELRFYSRQRWVKNLENDPSKGRVGVHKHNPKIHVLAGISRRGGTRAAFFTGKLDSAAFQDLFSEYITPFLREKYPNMHRLYMDNDPKHTSFSTYAYLERHFINHFKSPPQSPDLNPIELVWNDLKYFLETDFKPKTLSDLVIGISRFWEMKTIELNGLATGI